MGGHPKLAAEERERWLESTNTIGGGLRFGEFTEIPSLLDATSSCASLISCHGPMYMVLIKRA